MSYFGLIAYFNEETGFAQQTLIDPVNCMPLVGEYQMQLVSLQIKYTKAILQDTSAVLCSSFFTHFESSLSGAVSRFDPLKIFTLKRGDVDSEMSIDLRCSPILEFYNKTDLSFWIQSIKRSKIDLRIDVHFFLRKKMT